MQRPSAHCYPVLGTSPSELGSEIVLGWLGLLKWPFTRHVRGGAETALDSALAFTLWAKFSQLCAAISVLGAKNAIRLFSFHSSFSIHNRFTNCIPRNFKPPRMLCVLSFQMTLFFQKSDCIQGVNCHTTYEFSVLLTSFEEGSRIRFWVENSSFIDHSTGLCSKVSENPSRAPWLGAWKVSKKVRSLVVRHTHFGNHSCWEMIKEYGISYSRLAFWIK